MWSRSDFCDESWFPILKGLKRHLEAKGNLNDVSIGWHCHLTNLTAQAASVLIEVGARLAVSECNPDTTDPSSVAFMQGLGAKVYLGADGPQAVLSANPSIVSDTGCVLISCYHKDQSSKIYGACEITTSGIARLRSIEHLLLPVINVSDCQLKTRIENFHGVGLGLVEALSCLTGRAWAGRVACVVGYGSVGAGAAHYLRNLGADVAVVEINPVRALVAHYDGFRLSTLQTALSSSELLVTATGTAGILGERQWRLAADGLLVVNLGHWSAEVEPETIKQMASSRRVVNEHLQEFTLLGEDAPTIKKVYLASGGNPVNVALLSGPVEPTLIHLTTEILCLEYLADQLSWGKNLPNDMLAVPEEVERLASELALEALGGGQKSGIGMHVQDMLTST